LNNARSTTPKKLIRFRGQARQTCLSPREPEANVACQAQRRSKPYADVSDVAEFAVDELSHGRAPSALD